MKNLKVLAALGLTTICAPLFANACSNLNISIENSSGHSCKLVQFDISSGQIINGNIPLEIANGQTSRFTMQQEFIYGPKVQLEYQCENKSVAITTSQGLCFGYAGNVYGSAKTSVNVKASLIPTPGSWWNSQSGEANWHIN